jgi:hypothetical protein
MTWFTKKYLKLLNFNDFNDLVLDRGATGWGEGGWDLEREKVRRAWSARGRRDINKCWLCGRRSWLVET